MNFVNDVRNLRPVQAWHSMRALIANPDDTGEVFKIVEALKGGSLSRALERLQAGPDGRELLQRKPGIVPMLNDRQALGAMPEGSLGRAYLEFVESEKISADGLLAASEAVPRGRDNTPDERWLANRLRDIHDLQHVMCGYGRDELGELCLLAFMAAQTPNRGISFIVFMGCRQFRLRAPQIPIKACVDEGRRMGKTAKWFATVSWEECLSQPLQQLRAELGVQLPTVYRSAISAVSRANGETGRHHPHFNQQREGV